MHCVTCVQGGHFDGIAEVLRRCRSRPAGSASDAPGTAQQPKQSQPFGTSFWHLSTQFCDCDADTEHSVAC